MSFVIFFFGSGFAFFAGVALVLLGVAVTRWRPRLSWVPAMLGLIVIALSAAPLPYWLYAVAGLITVVWFLAEAFRRKLARVSLIFARTGVAIVWLSAAALELPYLLGPDLDISGRPALWVVGDSVTAGLGDKKTETWPGILAHTHGIEVHDLSQMGATVASAHRRLEKDPPGDGIILLEIGGNDLLGSTSAADFDRHLSALLALVCRPGRRVLMFELPLPPLCNEYGLAQRRLAAKHGVGLIPKRILVGVLTAGGATLDSIHLTQRGHEAMAEAVWALVRKAYNAAGTP
jgi:acyl-CoA thioesterase-1